MMIREEFLGFVEVTAMGAISIASAIDNFLANTGLDPEKCVGQGYDGCSTMAGKDGGVQKILREKYTRGLYFHCASHKLNLVVNDLNQLAVIRNTVATIKEIIDFFENPHFGENSFQTCRCSVRPAGLKNTEASPFLGSIM